MFNTTEKTTKILLILLYVLACHSIAEAASPKQDVKEGNLRYEQGDYAASREKYLDALEKDPESDIVNFNLGTAFYKEEDYKRSVDHLQKVLLSDDEELKEDAHYNLGNALYRSGLTHVEDDINVAISSLENSLSQYKRALSIHEEDKDAKHNYDYVQRALIRLQDQQKQQQQQQQDQQSQEGQEEQQKQQESKQQERQQQQGQPEESGEEKQEQSGKGEQQQEQQEKSDQGRGQEGEGDYNKQQEARAQPQDAEELTQKEAQMLLDSYQQTEEPQGLLKVYPQTRDTRPVFKDW